MTKKIAFFCDNFIVGGVERVLVNICNILSESGNDVTIIWTGYVEDNFLLKQLNPKIKQISAVEKLKLEATLKPKNDFWKRKIWRIKKAIDKYKLRNISKHIDDFSSFDVLVDFKNGDGFVSNMRSFPNQTKVVWIHGSYSLYGRAKFIKRNKIFNYDKIVCLTKEFQDHFTADYPKEEQKIVHIYNPFDIETVKNKSLEQNEDIFNYAPFFVCVSRLDNDKDIITVLNACKVFYQDETRKNKMVFLGDGRNAQKFKDFVKENNLTDKVFFLGNVANPYSWIKSAQALIMSSKNEGLPTVLMEAQICETLCVSSNCPCGPKEILEDGQSGILFDVGDYNKLAQIMEDIENQKIDGKEYANKALSSLSRFDKDSFINSFRKII